MPGAPLLPQNFHKPHVSGDTECPLIRAETAANMNKIGETGTNCGANRGRICASPVDRQHACQNLRQRQIPMYRKLLTPVALFAVIALSVLHPEPASAQHRGGHVRGPVFVGGYFYDPFFGPYPWWGPSAF